MIRQDLEASIESISLQAASCIETVCSVPIMEYMQDTFALLFPLIFQSMQKMIQCAGARMFQLNSTSARVLLVWSVKVCSALNPFHIHN